MTTRDTPLSALYYAWCTSASSTVEQHYVGRHDSSSKIGKQAWIASLRAPATLDHIPILLARPEVLVQLTVVCPDETCTYCNLFVPEVSCLLASRCLPPCPCHFSLGISTSQLLLIALSHA